MKITQAASTPPLVFVSYSWDDSTHKDWVRNLATELQAQGVAVRLDQWDTHPGIDLPAYMERSVREADFVILVCTPQFRLRADAGRGGVGYEKMVVTGEVFSESAKPGKFVPILRAGSSTNALPTYLKSKVYVDFRDDAMFSASLEELLRHVHAAPRYVRPKIGPRPDFPAAPDIVPLASLVDGGATYCSACGMVPGSYSTCLGSRAHDFQRFAGPKESIFCVRCGMRPGSYSSCLGSNKHGYTQYPGRADSVYCKKCGNRPGMYSSCLGSQSHAYEVL
jgi:hypothetical protein